MTFSKHTNWFKYLILQGWRKTRGMWISRGMWLREATTCEPLSNLWSYRWLHEGKPRTEYFVTLNGEKCEHVSSPNRKHMRDGERERENGGLNHPLIYSRWVDSYPHNDLIKNIISRLRQSLACLICIVPCAPSYLCINHVADWGKLPLLIRLLDHTFHS